jgi:hypothetical protein
MTVFRREKKMEIDVTFGSEPPRQWRLEVTALTDAQKARQAAWLLSKS